MRTIGKLALVAMGVAFLARTPDAAASCTERRSLQTFQNQMPPYTYSYIDAGTLADVSASALRGRFWQLGSRSVMNEGTYPKNKWLYTSAPGINVEARLDAAGVVGCPTRGATMLTLVETTAKANTVARFAAMAAPEVPTNPVAWNYTRIGTKIAMADVPKPGFQQTAPYTPPNLNGTVTYFPVQNGVYTAGTLVATVISGFQLMGAKVDSATPGDPGRDPAAWTVLQTVDYQGLQINLPLTLDCSDSTKDWVLAIRIRYDGAVLGAYVSESIRVDCP